MINKKKTVSRRQQEVPTFAFLFEQRTQNINKITFRFVIINIFYITTLCNESYEIPLCAICTHCSKVNKGNKRDIIMTGNLIYFWYWQRYGGGKGLLKASFNFDLYGDWKETSKAIETVFIAFSIWLVVFISHA